MLALEGIRCAYDGTEVLRGVSLRIGAGEIVAVAGPNGSGKSTLLRAAGRLLAPKAGRVTLDGRDLYREWESRAAARRIATVPQDFALEFDFTVREVVAMGRYPHEAGFRGPGPDGDRAVRLAMERTGTAELADRPAPELSGGERRRVLLARALAQEAPILLLDEPTAHLDFHFQVETLRLVQRHAEAGGAAILVLHDLNLAAAYAQRLVLLRDGVVAAEGPVRELLREETLVPVFGPEVAVRPHPDGGPLVLPRKA